MYAKAAHSGACISAHQHQYRIKAVSVSSAARMKKISRAAWRISLTQQRNRARQSSNIATIVASVGMARTVVGDAAQRNGAMVVSNGNNESGEKKEGSVI